jgi:hypothetical protein
VSPLSFTVFCSDVLGVTLEPAQRVFWSVAGGEVQPRELEGDDRDLARAIFGDVDEVPEGVRGVVAMLKGADIGATFVGGLRLLWRALTAPMGDAAPGEVRPALAVAPDVRTGRQPVRVARGFAEQVPQISALIESATSDAIVFRRDGGRFSSVECLPASIGGKATRGRRYLEAVLDEASFFRDEASGAVNDQHVFQSVVARCTGTVWIPSTPWLETSLIWQLYEKNYGKPTTALAARLPTLLVRTSERTRRMVEQERERDPMNAAREYDCQPLSTGTGALFDGAAIKQAVDDKRPLVIVAGTYQRRGMAVDLGFVRNSSTAVVVGEDPDRPGHYTVCEVLELRPEPNQPLKPSEVCSDFMLLARRHSIDGLLADGHYLESLKEHLRGSGVGVFTTPAGAIGKEQMFVATRNVLHQGRLHLPNVPRLIQQLREVTARATAGGGLSIAQRTDRSGAHGDIVSSLVAVVWALEQGRLHPPRRDVDYDRVGAALHGELESYDREHGIRSPWNP